MFILADNRRYDAMSFLNHQFAGVPHMDGMAAGSRTQANCTISNRLQGRYATCCAGKPTSKLRERMGTRLYETRADLDGIEIPMNVPLGRLQEKRLRSRGGK